MTRPAIERFKEKYVVTDDGCWTWTGATNNKGYGVLSIWPKTTTAHKWSYRHHKGPVPDGLQIDHLCRNRLCVNPEHLEAVTYRENQLRGDTFLSKGSSDEVCRNGHSRAIHETRNSAGHRTCRQCNRDSCRRSKARRRNQTLPLSGEARPPASPIHLTHNGGSHVR